MLASVGRQILSRCFLIESILVSFESFVKGPEYGASRVLFEARVFLAAILELFVPGVCSIELGNDIQFRRLVVREKTMYHCDSLVSRVKYLALCDTTISWLSQLMTKSLDFPVDLRMISRCLNAFYIQVFIEFLK